MLPSGAQVHAAEVHPASGIHCAGEIGRRGSQVGFEIVIVCTFAIGLPVETQHIVTSRRQDELAIGITVGCSVAIGIVYTIVVGDIHGVGTGVVHGGVDKPTIGTIVKLPAKVIGGLKTSSIGNINNREGFGAESNPGGVAATVIVAVAYSESLIDSSRGEIGEDSRVTINGGGGAGTGSEALETILNRDRTHIVESSGDAPPEGGRGSGDVAGGKASGTRAVAGKRSNSKLDIVAILVAICAAAERRNIGQARRISVAIIG